jgi:FtsP/CotA-like multicopper oxidase with cupredoxin domain
VHGKTKFHALAYRSYTPNFAKPLGPPQIPGPLIEAQTGDTVIVNFRNETGTPATIHPHGIFYTQDMDGSYKGKYTDPGGFVQSGHTFRYVWEARPGTEGAWLYHDHGPMDPIPVFKGLFGHLIIRKPGDPIPDREFFLAFHSFTPLATNLDNSFSCINGRAYAGNTPTLRSKVGETVAFYVFALDDDFHTFHVHGHRWIDPDGSQLIDNKTIGPGDIITVKFTEDNPGRWFYHCHVFSHLHMGMNGWYLVSA